MTPRLFFFVMLSALVMNAWGCATTQPTDFYMLSALTSPEHQSEPELEYSERSLGVGPITFPQYLNRPQIVTRASRYKLTLDEFNKWAEQLEGNFAQVVAENLSILLPTEQVDLFPWELGNSVDYQLMMDVLEFDGNPSGDASLLVRWSLVNADEEIVVVKRKSRFTRTPDDDDYESLVEALSETVADLSREIAEAVKALPEPMESML
jgi:uncharacterized lipoprotein YmbA